MRLYTLGSRGSRELKTFLETRLISSRVDQKLNHKGGKYIGFKEEVCPKIGAVWCAIGCLLVATITRGSWSSTSPNFGLDFCCDRTIVALDRGHDRTTIGPRSRDDRSSIMVLPPGFDFAVWWGSIPPIMHFDSDQTDADSAAAIGDDRGAIGPRSNCDRGPRSWDIIDHCRPIWSGKVGGPIAWSGFATVDVRTMRIRRSGKLHASPRWEEIMLHRGCPIAIARRSRLMKISAPCDATWRARGSLIIVT